MVSALGPVGVVVNAFLRLIERIMTVLRV